VELVEVADGEHCCGSAGIYNLVQPESAAQVGRRKAEAVLATKATLLASANPGCSLQIRRMLEERGGAIEAAHPIEILDRAIRAGSGGKAP
jgi:glycolate oxidase iron-sulfur subunit